MSFGSEVKRELMNIELTDKIEQKFLIMGLLHNSSEISLENNGFHMEWKIVIKSTILNVIKFIAKYLKENYNCHDELKTKSKNSLNEFRYYYLELTKIDKVIEDFHLLDYTTETITIKSLGMQNLEYQNLYLRGLFLAHGSISDPRISTYHFEISTSKSFIAKIAHKIFTNNGINSLIHERVHQRADDTYLVYIKRAEDISQALIVLGATQGMFNFEDQRIYRDFKNMANRVTNCDIANERKCLETCQKQLDAIKYIRERNKFYDMSVRLQSIAILRETYPESSNTELSDYSENIFGKKLSKSGISHCFRSLMEFYDDLKGNPKH